MPIPLDKLIDLNQGRYEIANAAMKMVSDISGLETGFDPGEKIAVYSLAKVLNGQVKFVMNTKIPD